MYPKFKDKHSCSSLITAEKHLSHYKKVRRYPSMNPPETVIFCYHGTFFERVLNRYSHKQCDGCFNQLYYLSDYPSTAIANFGIGAPLIATKLELLATWGVKNFISIGLAGTLQPDLHIGDLVVCEKAIRDEGTSHHYHPHEEFAYPSDALTQKLIQSLEMKRVPFRKGASWTIDTLYRQTEKEVKHLQEEGILTVEMEAAALFTIAHVCKVNLASAFSISDSLATLNWDPHFYHEPVFKGLDTLLEACLDNRHEL